MARTNTVPHNQAVKLNAAERRQRAIELRKSGATLHQIAAQTGVSHEQARKDIERAFADLLAEQNAKTEELRAMELERLERMHLALWKQALEGHHGAIDRLLRIAERRAKLLGLDAPAKVAHTDPEGRAVAFNVLLAPPPAALPPDPDDED